MAKVKFSVLVEHIRGSLGDFVFRRHGDDMIVARKPAPSRFPPTEAQEKRKNRFKRAVEYAKRILRRPEARARYEKAARSLRRRAWNVIISDFLHKPSVDKIDASEYAGSPGDVITISATDDLEVAGVSVVLTDADGEVIEEGEAAALTDSLWAYTATETVPADTAVRIVATATDMPGGAHTRESEVVV